MVKLDLKDRKILFELDTNCRQTYQGIGRKVRLSKDSVFYRIRRLEEEGIIERYQTLIDIGKLGYTSYRIFYKLQNTTSKLEEEIVEYLKKQKIVGWMVTIEGYWDINTWILCKEISELEEFWKGFSAKYLNYLADKQMSIYTDITYFSRAYLLEDKENTFAIKFVSAPRKMPQTDNMDVKILHVLNMNARESVIEIAKKVGMSAKQVAHRIKEMEKRKVIVGYRTLFDLQKLGYLYYRLHIKVKDMSLEKEREFRRFAFRHPNIIYDHYSICGPDLEIDVQVESVERFRQIIQEIKNRFSDIIQGYETMHYLKEHKYIYMPEE